MALLLFIAVGLLSAGNAFAVNMALIEPSTLNAELSKWVILDGRPKSEWQAGRIPGSLSFSWEDFTRTDEQGIPFRIFPPKALASTLGAMSIDEKTPIVVYGDADKSWGGEGWVCWALAWMGHEGPIRVLNGGVQAWRNANLPMNAEALKGKARVSYNFKLAPQMDIFTAEIEHPKTPMVLIDTRSTMEWLPGAIPGAIHIEWIKFYTGSDRRPLDASALKRLLNDNGVDISKPIVYYCRGGIRSGYAWMVHQLAGLPDARNYEGGMEAWWKLSGK
ncbi:MAG: hypothetical protein HQK86_09670 [Nitrospinae bacterium]|nr:hypothetical protein [Nitrospinota bacterium]